jgi:hypothetical protein
MAPEDCQTWHPVDDSKQPKSHTAIAEVARKLRGEIRIGHF